MQAAPDIGSILLGKYRVERVLGQGGMGFVVAARHEELGELFAIKMMLPHALAFEGALERFMREARLAARLKGEHVARVHDVGKFENGAPYMVMEHLTGDDLSRILDKRGALPVGEAALYAYQACEAVAEAHALGILHRDLKPSNMFLTRRPNDTLCVKVIDFGISKDLDPNKVGPALTKTGMMVGTPSYMAPEQMANNKSMDARSDIWSLGVILYELVTGEVPFLADSMTELVSAVLTKSPVPTSRVRPGIPPAFDAIVLRCLEKQPDRRFATVRDLMIALHPFVGANLPQAMTGPPPVRPSAPAGIPAAANSPYSGVPMGSHGLPRLNVTDATTGARPLPFGANLPYVATVQSSTFPETLASAGVQGSSMPALEPRQTNGAWSGTSGSSSGKHGKAWLVAGLTVGGIIVLGAVGVIVSRFGASEEKTVAGAASPSFSVVRDDARLPSASAAPLDSAVSVQPVVSVQRTVDEIAAKPAETVAAPVPTTSTQKVGGTKSIKTTSKVPDF